MYDDVATNASGVEYDHRFRRLAYAPNLPFNYNDYGTYYPPLVTDGIPVWFQTVTSDKSTLIHTSSAKQTPYVVTLTPTTGGTTIVSGGTTSTVSSGSWSSGNLTYATTAWVDIFGGDTSVINVTVIPVTIFL
ncbi:hypothetical protein F66182_14333 [Fusarium sp. NRRL 66182]|nr:hypothetical protein F66182_14333 [Fusarium sp. NRRL 66182]